MELRVRYVVVGLFALIVGLAGIGFALWIQNKGSIRGRLELIVRFDGPAPGLRAGAPVTFNGVRVGEVTRLTFDRSNLAAVNAYTALDPDTPVTTTTQASLEAQGLLGAVYVSLVGGDASQPLPAGQKPPVIVAGPATSISQEAREALEGIKSVVSDNAAPLHDVITNIQTFSGVLSRNSDRIDGILQGLEKTLGGGSDKASKPPMYDLPAPKTVEGFSDVPEAALVVNDPTMVVAYDTQRLLMESATGQLTPQAVEWPDSIPKLLQKRVLQTFDNVGFKAASSPMDNVPADFQLSLDIRAFQIVEGQPSQAKVAFGARLLDPTGKVIDSHIIEAEMATSSNDVAGQVDAMRKAFDKALGDLVLWYKSAAEAKP